MRRVGIAFAEQPFSVPEIVTAARRAEDLGLESVWLAQDLWTRRDGLTILACVAAATDRVHVGSSLLNPYLHHPLQIAMILNTLADLAPARLRLGIGSGLPFWQPLFPERVRREPPLKAVPNAVRDLRRLLGGEAITYGDESISLTLARPCYPHALPQAVGRVPIYVGAKGPKMTRIAGRIGDGLLLGASTRMDELERQLGDLAAGARDAGRAVSDIDVASIIVTSVSSDGAIDANTLGAVAARMSRLSESEAAALELDAAAVARVRSAYHAGDCVALRDLISVDVAARWAAVGTPDQCLPVIRRQIARGVTLPILFTFGCDVNDLLDLGARLAAESS